MPTAYIQLGANWSSPNICITRATGCPGNYWNPQLLLLLRLASGWSFARSRSLQIIICKWLAPLNDNLQEAGTSGSPFARGRPLRMTIWKRTVPLDHHLQEAGPSLWQPQKRHEKCIFETLHNETKCVLSVKESNFNEKKDQNFHICLELGPRWLTPLTPVWSAWP